MDMRLFPEKRPLYIFAVCHRFVNIISQLDEMGVSKLSYLLLLTLGEAVLVIL